MIVLGFNNDPNSSKNKGRSKIFVKLLPLIAFAVPFALLYFLNPLEPSSNGSAQVFAQSSFELMWKGRTFQLFFIWLVALEFILSWETIQSKINLQNKGRLLLFAITLLLPAFYIILEYYLNVREEVFQKSF